MITSRTIFTGLLMLSTFALTSCVSREQADQRLANGCAAGAEIFLEEGVKIQKIKDQKFRDDPKLGKGYREVTLNVLEGDGWYETDKQYKCIFAESMGPFGASHTATIYQLKMDDQVYGKEGDKLLGTFQDHLKLTETVEQGLNR